MIIPAAQTLQGVIGATWDAEFLFFQDTAETQPFDLTGYTVAVEIEGVATLTEGAGLTIDRPGGTVTAQLGATTTAKIPRKTTGYRVKLYTTPDDVDFPVADTIEWSKP